MNAKLKKWLKEDHYAELSEAVAEKLAFGAYFFEDADKLCFKYYIVSLGTSNYYSLYARGADSYSDIERCIGDIISIILFRNLRANEVPTEAQNLAQEALDKHYLKLRRICIDNPQMIVVEQRTFSEMLRNLRQNQRRD